MRGYSFAAFQRRTTCTWRKKIPLITLHCRGTAGEEGNNKQMTLRNKKAIIYACVGFWGKIGKGEVEVYWFDILHPSHTVAAGVTVVARWPRITLVRNSRTEVVQIMFAQKTQIVSVRVSAACYVAPPPSCIELKRSKRMWEVQSIAYELDQKRDWTSKCK